MVVYEFPSVGVKGPTLLYPVSNCPGGRCCLGGLLVGSQRLEARDRCL